MTRDLNFHFDEPRDASVCRFLGQLDTDGHVPHVTATTHRHSHMSDDIITHGISSVVHIILVYIYIYILSILFYDAKGNQCGDLFGIEVTLECSKPRNLRKKINIRTLARIFICNIFVCAVLCSAVLCCAVLCCLFLTLHIMSPYATLSYVTWRYDTLSCCALLRYALLSHVTSRYITLRYVTLCYS